MRLSGLHFLLTYKCNCQCDHCFLSCGPDFKESATFEDIKKYIDEAKQIPSINYFFIEGGEPFLYPKIALETVKYSTEKGYWIGILSNGFWAKTVDKGIEILKPFKDAGLGEIGISTDKFHQQKVPFEKAANAVLAAEKLQIPVSIMATTDSKTELKQLKKQAAAKGIKAKIYGSLIRGRGRGSLICQGKPTKWQKLTSCGENLEDPGRVHIGPEGAIHLCQDVLLGQNAKELPLKQIFEGHSQRHNQKQSKENPIVDQLIKGGPAALAEWAAQNYGFQPKDRYLQDCQLCYDVRCFLEEKRVKS